MYYHGKFRNIDTSIDPRGQEYKVVIFTGYNGSESPYTFNFEGEPNLGIELTMTTSPFIVSYQNEDNNIFKPYKCSTATVSFIMNSFNSDLFSGNNDILVALLKRNNDIVRQGDSYINRLTNEVVIRKRAFGLFYGFLPAEEDTYCYTLEWIGFATPNTYNQNYTLLNQPFQLECQDAFSTLKYISLPFNEVVEIQDLKEIINTVIGELGCYKNIYYPSNIFLPDTNNTSTSFSKIVQQYRNWIEKNSEPIDKLELLTGIGEFLNVSFVPFRDSIYIVNYNGVANNDNYFYHYSIIPNNNLFFNFSGENYIGWNESVLESKEKNITLGKESFAGSDTNISMQTIYSNFAVKCNEKEYDLMPDLSDNNNFSDSTNNFTAPLEAYQIPALAPENFRRWNLITTWKRGVISNFQYIDNVGFKNHIFTNPIVNGGVITESLVEVYPELTVSNDGDSVNIFRNNTGCVSLKNTIISSNELYESFTGWRVSNTYTTQNYSNDIVFFGYAPNESIHLDYFWDTNLCVLEYQSPKFIYPTYPTERNLQIKGDWTFFNNYSFIDSEHSIYYRYGSLLTNDEKCIVRNQFLYVPVKVVLTIEDGTNVFQYCLKRYIGSSEDYFRWEALNSPLLPEDSLDSIDRCYLPLEDENINKDKPFGQAFSLKNLGGEDSGFIVEFPDLQFQTDGNNLIASVRIGFIRPLGVAKTNTNIDPTQVYCGSSVLRNFSVGLCDKESIETWGYGEIETDFHTKEKRYLESFEVENKLSSNQYINKMAYNYSFRIFNHNYYPLDCLNNTSTSIIARPEILKLADIYNQYKDKTIALNTTVWNNLDIQPNTRIKWGQFRNINFIVDRQEIDYEYNRNTLTLVEKKLSSEIPELDLKMWLENENGQTLNYNPFYNEHLLTITVSSYSADGSMITGTGGDSVNALIQFYPKWTDGVEAWVSIPNVLDDDIEVEINNNGELIITN